MEIQVRQTLAVETSQTIAAKYGVPHGHPTILKDNNHTIVHLKPFPIVAKVSIEKRFRYTASSLKKELLVANCSLTVGHPSFDRAAAYPQVLIRRMAWS